MGSAGFINMLKNAAILFLIGAFVSAQQVCACTVIIAEEPLEFEKMLVEAPDFQGAEIPAFHAAGSDTLETIDIEVEEDKGTNYKEIAAYVVVAAAVTIILYILLKPEKDETESEDDGKPTPKSRIAVVLPLNW